MPAQLSAPISFAHAATAVIPTAHVSLTPSVLDRVQRVLADSSYSYLRRVSCAYDNGVLTLRGRMPTFYLKQTLQVLVAKVEGVQQIVNLVEVANPAARY